METITTFFADAFAAQAPMSARDLVITFAVVSIALGCVMIGTMLENMRLMKELQRVKEVSSLKWDAYMGAADEVDYLKQKCLRQQAVIDACELQERTMTFSPDAGFVDDIPFD